MAKFRVVIYRTEAQAFIVEADNGSVAVNILSDAWNNGKVELDDPDQSDTDFVLINRADDNESAML